VESSVSPSTSFGYICKTKYSLLVVYFYFVIILFIGASARIDSTMTSMKSTAPHSEGVEAFVHGMTSEVNAADVSRMMTLQQHMYVT